MGAAPGSSASAPPPGRVCLIHADFRTGNYLVDEGELTAILDWEFAAFGDPLEDLGWMLVRYWRFGAYEREAGGIGSRAGVARRLRGCRRTGPSTAPPFPIGR